ncbi:hypothetical protein [Pseudoalteromonas xiamenensis]
MRLVNVIKKDHHRILIGTVVCWILVQVLSAGWFYFLASSEAKSGWLVSAQIKKVADFVIFSTGSLLLYPARYETKFSYLLVFLFAGLGIYTLASLFFPLS